MRQPLNNLTEITTDTKALDGYGMISETSEDSTSEAKELPGICKRNLGHPAVVQPETLKLKRIQKVHPQAQFLHRDYITWSTFVNIGQRHAQCPAKVLQRIADWRLLELKQSWRGYVMHLLESMIINDHPTSTLHTTPCHHLQINQIHSKTFRDTSNQYGKIFQAYATQHRHLQRGSCFVQLADFLRQPATSAT